MLEEGTSSELKRQGRGAWWVCWPQVAQVRHESPGRFTGCGPQAAKSAVPGTLPFPEGESLQGVGAIVLFGEKPSEAGLDCPFQRQVRSP